MWELIIQLPRDPMTGRTRQLSRTFHGTKREAQRALAAEVAQVSAGKVTATTQTVADLLASWYERAAPDLSPSTAREYRRLIDKRLLPALGRVRVRDLTPQQLDAFYGQLSTRGALAPASVRQVHAVLRRALAQAVRWGWLKSNPASNASPPKLRKPEITPPPQAEQDVRHRGFHVRQRGERVGEIVVLRRPVDVRRQAEGWPLDPTDADAELLGHRGRQKLVCDVRFLDGSPVLECRLEQHDVSDQHGLLFRLQAAERKVENGHVRCVERHHPASPA